MNRHERRKSASLNRRKEVKSSNAKRMDRPSKLDTINAGYEKLNQFFFNR